MSRGYPITTEMRAERRARAEVTQAKSAELTAQQRLAKLDDGGFVAAKERAKLAKRIAREAVEAQNPSKKAKK